MEAKVMNLPDNRRSPKGEGKINVKVWMETETVRDLDLLADAFGSSRSAVIRWLAEVGSKAKLEEIRNQRALEARADAAFDAARQNAS